MGALVIHPRGTWFVFLELTATGFFIPECDVLIRSQLFYSCQSFLRVLCVDTVSSYVHLGV